MTIDLLERNEANVKILEKDYLGPGKGPTISTSSVKSQFLISAGVNFGDAVAKETIPKEPGEPSDICRTLESPAAAMTYKKLEATKDVLRLPESAEAELLPQMSANVDSDVHPLCYIHSLKK